MRRIIRAILPILSRSKDQKSESQKTSYWLKKLFNQTRDIEKRDTKEEQNKTQIGTNGIFSGTKLEQTSEEKGIEQAVKNHAGKVEKNRQVVEDMVSNSNRILLKISSVFPWDLFPNTIIAEETRITIIHRQLFSSQVHSIDVRDISNIFVDTSIIFAQLTLVSNTFAENQIIIGRLWKKDAILMRRIIEGLRMFINKDIDTTGYKVEELVSKLKELSTTGIVL
jgi:hypothetical protein